MSRPMLRELEKEIERQGGEDVAVFQRIAAGDRIGIIAADLGCSRTFLYVWRKRRGHRERRMKKWEEAMRVRALAKAEEAEDVLDALAERSDAGEELTSAKVALARERANYKKWLASRLDREQFGDDQQPQAVINVQSLHLQALRAVNTAHTLPPGQEIEAESDTLPEPEP